MQIPNKKLAELKKILTPEQIQEIIKIKNRKAKLNESFEGDFGKLLTFFDAQDQKMISDVLSFISEGPDQIGDEVFGDAVTEIKTVFEKIHTQLFDRDEDIDENHSSKL